MAVETHTPLSKSSVTGCAVLILNRLSISDIPLDRDESMVVVLARPCPSGNTYFRLGARMASMISFACSMVGQYVSNVIDIISSNEIFGSYKVRSSAFACMESIPLSLSVSSTSLRSDDNMSVCLLFRVKAGSAACFLSSLNVAGDVAYRPERLAR